MELRQIGMTMLVSLGTVAASLLVAFLLFREHGLPDALSSRATNTLIPSDVATESAAPTETNLIPDIIETVNPAVVSVVVTKDVPIYEEYYEDVAPFGFFGQGFSVPRIRENGTEEREVGGGSGFIVSADGLIVTNRHVVDDSEARYSVLLNDGTSHQVIVLARDPQLDIAVLQVVDLPERSLTYLTFGDSESLRLGESVIAIGNALAEFRNSVSVGVISGLSRSIVASDGMGMIEQLDQVIQTDAAINPGNSGGPLLNLDGEVIGVNVATSRGADNISFALPAHVVSAVVTSVEQYGEIVRPFIGVRYTMVTPRLQEANNLPVDYGALVIRGTQTEDLAVMPGSPADSAGITENTIILSIDGEELRERDLGRVLRNKTVGQTITLDVLQAGERRTVDIVLQKTPL